MGVKCLCLLPAGHYFWVDLPHLLLLPHLTLGTLEISREYIVLLMWVGKQWLHDLRVFLVSHVYFLTMVAGTYTETCRACFFRLRVTVV